jgi:alkylation response protein AidB-like acyl-CoA dehydrogenase
MNFGFSEEQEMLRESATKFLDAQCPPSFVRRMMEDETGHSTELWRRLAAMGWLGVLIPRKLGGMGGTFLDAAVLLEEMGKALLPGPFFSTVMWGAVALDVAGSAAQRTELLPRIADGSLVLALAVLEHCGEYDPPAISLTAKRKAADFVLRGEKRFVLDAGVADWILVAARTAAATRSKPDHGISLFLVERGAPGMLVTPVTTIDRTRRQAHLRFDGVAVPAKRLVGRLHGAWRDVARALEVATTAVCVETVGVAQRALELSVRYAKERTQFGSPIGAFQAVKHKCVDMMVAVENARSLAYHAAWTVAGRKREARRAVAMAKAYTSDMGKNVTGDAIQVHGGTGYTWEHDVHLYYRRALANEATFGSAPLHREAVARLLKL